MLNSDVDEYGVAAATAPLAALPRNLSTEETMEEEDIPIEICYYYNYTNHIPNTPTPQMTLP